MADTKISALTAGAPALRSDMLPARRGAGNVSLLVGDIQGPASNFAATVAPTATDDANAGYAPGSSWLRVDTGEMWRCRSATAGAAVWIKIDTADFDVYQAGRYYIPFGMGQLAAGVSSAPAFLRLAYGVIKQRITIDQLLYRITTAGGNEMVAIYKSLAGKPTGLPVAKTVSTATASTTTYNIATDTGNVQLEPGSYWFGGMSDVANVPLSYNAIGPTPAELGASTALGAMSVTPLIGLSVPVTYGTWPDLTSATFTDVMTQVIPAVGFRVASVP